MDVPYPGTGSEVVIKVNNQQLLLDGAEVMAIRQPGDTYQGLNMSRLIIVVHVCTDPERVKAVVEQAESVGYEKVLMDRYGSRADVECTYEVIRPQ